MAHTVLAMQSNIELNSVTKNFLSTMPVLLLYSASQLYNTIVVYLEADDLGGRFGLCMEGSELVCGNRKKFKCMPSIQVQNPDLPPLRVRGICARR